MATEPDMGEPDEPPLPEAFVFRWGSATITAITPVTPRVRSVRLATPIAAAYRAGQHVDVRLTAADGYRAQRSYSIASAPDGSGTLELMIETFDDGEVSGYFAEVAEPGDAIELRGPIGGAFSWDGPDGGPLLLVGGGSGVVPLLAMLRRRAQAAPDVPAALIVSARTRTETIALAELEARARDDSGFHLFALATREPGGRRIDRAVVDRALARLGAPARVFACGDSAFVGAASDLLIAAGVPHAAIRTERFGA